MERTTNNRDSVPITADLIKRVSDGMDEAIRTRPKDIFTKREMLVQLHEKLTAMRKAGFTIEQISAWIKQTVNVSVSPATIRAAMNPHAKKKKRARRAAAMDTQKISPSERNGENMA